MEPADWIGWTSSAILLATLARQVFVQYRERSTQGLSGWLFVGQLAASTGFLVYSFLVNNWVFVFTNAALLITALVGQVIYRRNVRREEKVG
jgi:MtN3 and saliva related transmembrane protein